MKSCGSGRFRNGDWKECIPINNTNGNQGTTLFKNGEWQHSGPTYHYENGSWVQVK